MKKLISSLFILILLCTSFAFAEGHEHKVQSLPAMIATCGKPGHTAGEKCTECGEILSGLEEIPALSHAYGEWKLVKGSAQHQATCKNLGCRQKLTVNCAQYTFVQDGLRHNVCPLCGDSCEDSLFTLVKDITVASADGAALPEGKLVVMGSYTPFTGRVLYSFTLVWDHAGEVADLSQPLTVTIPLKVSADSAQLALRTAFGADGSHKDINKLLDYTWENGMLTFTAERGGLYTLSVPVQ